MADYHAKYALLNIWVELEHATNEMSDRGYRISGPRTIVFNHLHDAVSPQAIPLHVLDVSSLVAFMRVHVSQEMLTYRNSQLHCLYMMARIYHGVASNRVEGLPNDYHFHFMHCVDYIRQGAMCTADLAIEVHEETDSDDFGPQDGGWSGHHGESNHVCSNEGIARWCY